MLTGLQGPSLLHGTLPLCAPWVPQASMAPVTCGPPINTCVLSTCIHSGQAIISAVPWAMWETAVVQLWMPRLDACHHATVYWPQVFRRSLHTLWPWAAATACATECGGVSGAPGGLRRPAPSHPNLHDNAGCNYLVRGYGLYAFFGDLKCRFFLLPSCFGTARCGRLGGGPADASWCACVHAWGV